MLGPTGALEAGRVRRLRRETRRVALVVRNLLALTGRRIALVRVAAGRRAERRRLVEARARGGVDRRVERPAEIVRLVRRTVWTGRLALAGRHVAIRVVVEPAGARRRLAHADAADALARARAGDVVVARGAVGLPGAERRVARRRGTRGGGRRRARDEALPVVPRDRTAEGETEARPADRETRRDRALRLSERQAPRAAQLDVQKASVHEQDLDPRIPRRGVLEAVFGKPLLPRACGQAEGHLLPGRDAVEIERRTRHRRVGGHQVDRRAVRDDLRLPLGLQIGETRAVAGERNVGGKRGGDGGRENDHCKDQSSHRSLP